MKHSQTSIPFSILLSLLLILGLLSGCSGTQELDNELEPTDAVSATPTGTEDAEKASSDEPATTETPDTDRVMMEGNWAKETRARIQDVIDNNADKGKYVVFDFDNTSVIYDVQEALLIYQIENLIFAITPEEMPKVLRTGIPDMDKDMGTSLDGKAVTPETLVQDISAAYKWLYEHYKDLGDDGDMDLAAIHKTDEYKEFSTKLRFMYNNLGDYFDHAVSYPWVGYLFTGMTSDDVQELATASHKYWADFGVYEKVTWTSPEDVKSESGVLEVSYITGLNFTEELRNLYAVIANNKIDIYIISASPYETIVAANAVMDYGVPVENIFAMQYQKDSDGKYINEYNYDWGGKGVYAQTQGEGKTAIIRNFITRFYDGKGPLMVFGDSGGDMYMMTDWIKEGDTQLGVIFNRYRKPSDKMTWEASVEAAETIGDPDAQFVLQGRDENKGELRPSQKSILLGSDEEVLVRPAD